MGVVELVPGTVVDPVLDHAALENARLVNAARAELLRSGTAVTVDAMAEVLDKEPATVRRWIARQREAHRLATVSHEGQVLVPTAQLDEAFGLNDDTGEVVGRLVELGMDGWAIWHWLETPDTWLDGDSPAQRLAAGEVAAVHHAVDGMFQQ